jgi:hypothetical protein
MNVKRWSRLGAGLAAAMLVASTVQAQPLAFTTSLSGAAEFPPNVSPATGTAWAWYTPSTHTLRVAATFSGLLDVTTAAHIHCCVDPGAATPTASPATQVPSFALFPLGVTSGAFDQTLDLTLASSWNPGFIAANGGTVAGAEAAFATGLNAGDAYFNIHTARPNGVPSGEIRGFLTAVPEPSTYVLMSTGLLVLGGIAARRRRA